MALAGFLAFSAYNVLLGYGQTSVPAGTASLLIASIPAFTALWAVAFLHERLGAGHLDLDLVAELQHLGEVVPGVDVHHRERQRGRPERLACQVQEHRRVLATGEEQHPALELGCLIPAVDYVLLGVDRFHENLVDSRSVHVHHLADLVRDAYHRAGLAAGVPVPAVVGDGHRHCC